MSFQLFKKDAESKRKGVITFCYSKKAFAVFPPGSVPQKGFSSWLEVDFLLKHFIIMKS